MYNLLGWPQKTIEKCWIYRTLIAKTLYFNMFNVFGIFLNLNS